MAATSRKFCEQPQSHRLAFLRMELRAHDIAAPDHGGDGAVIIGGGENIALVLRDEFIGVHEIGVRAAFGIPSSNGMRRARCARSFQPICGTLISGSRRLDDDDFAVDPAKPRMIAEFAADGRPAIACPRKCRGTARRAFCTASFSASTMPGTAFSPLMQSANAPTPGSTMRSAFAATSGSAVTTISCPVPPSPAARASAFSAERKFPEP